MASLQSSIPRQALRLVVLAGLSVLTACGGDGDGGRATPTATLTATRAASVTATATATATVAAPSPTASPTAPPPSATASTSPTATLTVTSTPTITATASATPTATPPAGESGAMAPLHGAGRWFIDPLGRVVLLHGVNMVAKRDPYYPAALGFGADDAAFLADQGFTALRLGIDLRGLMPTPGVVEEDYIDRLAETVAELTAQGIFVLLDFHQDGFAPMYNGNGFPDWMAIDDGLPNPPDAVFPLYYILNPAMQRAFESFWANRAGPNGIGLQDYFIQCVERIATRFGGDPMVLGIELMNEPWPGATYTPCAIDPNGCPDLEQQLLMPFYRRGAAAARALAPDQFVFVEPFVLFNFGQARTSIPGTDPGLALSFHSYALDVAGEENVIANAVEAATRDGAPLLLTEFGASTDPVLLQRLTAQMERGIVPWMFWTYDESIIADLQQPPGPDNLRSQAAFDALVRPYPLAVTGTPAELAFEPTEKRFSFAYDTAPPPGVSYADNAVTVVSVPARHYPAGYTVQVEGAGVTSAPGAALLTLHNLPDAQRVTVQVSPP